MSLRLLVIILVVVLLIGLVPRWPYNAGWAGSPYGYAPMGGLGIVLVILIVLLLLGYL